MDHFAPPIVYCAHGVLGGGVDGRRCQEGLSIGGGGGRIPVLCAARTLYSWEGQEPLKHKRRQQSTTAWCSRH